MMQRDTKNKMIAGVCAGLAKQMGIDIVFMRAIFVLATLAGFGTPIIIYIVLALLMPPEE